MEEAAEPEAEQNAMQEEVVAVPGPGPAAMPGARFCEFDWYTSARAGGETCVACGKLWGRGCKIYRCRACRRVACAGCRDAAPGACPSNVQRAAMQPILDARGAGEDPMGEDLCEQSEEDAQQARNEAWWSAALHEATAEPAPSTIRHVPGKVKGRVNDLMLRALDAAVTSTEQQQPHQQQLEAHRWLWTLPSMLLAAPSHPCGGEAEDDDPEASGPKSQVKLLEVLRDRLKRAQEEDWKPLIEAHLRRLERLRRRAARQASDPRPVADETEEQREQRWAKHIIAKTKGGCLRTAARLVVGDEHAPQNDTTAAAIADLVAVPPLPGDRERAAALVSGILGTTMQRKQVGRRVVRQKARQLKAGAEPGPSGMRNSIVRDMAMDPRGSEIVARWCRLWAQGRFPPEVAKLWTQAVMVGLLKPSGGVRPIALGESMLKFAEVTHLEVIAPLLRQVLEPDQLGCRTPGGSECIIKAIRAAARQPGVAILQLDAKNAYGLCSRREMLEAAKDMTPDLAKMAACEWQTPVLAWTRASHGWTDCWSERGGWQGSALMQVMYAVALTWRLRWIEKLCMQQAPQEQEQAGPRQTGGWVAYADDTHLIGRPTELLRRLNVIEEELPKGGHELQAKKCHVWCPGAATLPPEEAAALAILEARTQRAADGLVLLGAGAGTESLAITETNLKPMTERVEKARKLADGLCKLAAVTEGGPVLQTCWILLHKVLARGLDYDARVVPAAGFARAAAELEGLERRVLDAILGMPSHPATHSPTLPRNPPATDAVWRRACAAGQHGGCGLRRPGLHRAGAYLTGGDAADELAARLLAQWGLSGAALGTEEERDAAIAQLRAEGIEVEAGQCSFTPETAKLIAATPWKRPEQRGRTLKLSGMLAHAELAEAARDWQTQSAEVREELRAGSGEGTGTLWACMPTTRSTTFGDQHWRQMLLDRLGMPCVLPGARCQHVRKRDRHCCGAPLGPQAKHADRCVHGGGGNRTHRAVQHAYARSLREAGANVDLERFVAEFTTPSQPEAYLDVVAHWPANPLLFAVDVTIRDPGARRYSGNRDCAGAGEGEKRRRYGTGVMPLALWNGGRMGDYSLQCLRVMAAEATRARLQEETRAGLIARWRLELEAALLWARADGRLRGAGRNLSQPVRRKAAAYAASAAAEHEAAELEAAELEVAPPLQDEFEEAAQAELHAAELEAAEPAPEDDSVDLDAELEEFLEALGRDDDGDMIGP